MSRTSGLPTPGPGRPPSPRRPGGLLSRLPRFAGPVAAVLFVALVVGTVLVLGQRGIIPSPLAARGAPVDRTTAEPGLSGTASTTAPPSIQPGTVGPPSPGAPFACSTPASGGAAGTSNLNGVQAAAQSGYDRIVLQFTGPVPQYNVRSEGAPVFLTDTGLPTTLQGTSGVLIVLHGSQSKGSYTGPADLLPHLGDLVEAKQIGDSSSTVQWGVGLAKPACFRVQVLTNPSRLEVDVRGF
jgi:hypothetical protein